MVLGTQTRANDICPEDGRTPDQVAALPIRLQMRPTCLDVWHLGLSSFCTAPPGSQTSPEDWPPQP